MCSPVDDLATVDYLLSTRCWTITLSRVLFPLLQACRAVADPNIGGCSATSEQLESHLEECTQEMEECITALQVTTQHAVGCSSTDVQQVIMIMFSRS